MSLNNTVYWVVTPCHLLEIYRCFSTSVNFYQTTQHHTQEDSTLYSHCCNNLKSLKLIQLKSVIKTDTNILPKNMVR